MNPVGLPDISALEGKKTSNMVNNVISDLNLKGDIQGAVLMDGDGHFIASALPNESMSHGGLSELLPRLLKHYNRGGPSARNTVFPHLVSQGLGCRILAKSVTEDLFLLVMLRDSCYLGPAMLDMVNSIMKIQDILNLQDPTDYQK